MSLLDRKSNRGKKPRPVPEMLENLLCTDYSDDRRAKSEGFGAAADNLRRGLDDTEGNNIITVYK